MVEQAQSKTDLLERRAERDLVREGKSVLEERRDLLARRVLEQIDAVESLTKRSEDELQRARTCFRLAAGRHGVHGLRAFARAATTRPAPDWQVNNRLGVAWLEPEAHTIVAPAPELGEGWDISLALETATVSLHDYTQTLIVLAVAQGNLARLVTAFRRIQRRVSALEHVVLPELDTTIRRIEESLDELERDDLSRALLIKRRRGQDRRNSVLPDPRR